MWTIKEYIKHQQNYISKYILTLLKYSICIEMDRIQLSLLPIHCWDQVRINFKESLEKAEIIVDLSQDTEGYL